MTTPSPIPSVLDGGCLCGAVRYHYEGAPLMLYTCHCTDCQRTTGSAFGMSLMVLRDTFKCVQGEPRRFTKRFDDDGREKHAMFCADCCTRLWTEFSKATHVVNIRPGTLDDTSWLRPVGAIWTGSAQPWVQLPQDAPCFESQPANMLELLEAWQRAQS